MGDMSLHDLKFAGFECANRRVTMSPRFKIKITMYFIFKIVVPLGKIYIFGGDII
jgi:hypothetical protein